jgi:hypothetical protein
MEHSKNTQAIPESVWSKDPEVAQQLMAARDYLEKTPFSKAFPNKYKAITKDKVTQKTRLLFEENPNIPLKNVVAIVLNSLNDDLSAELVLDMTKVIVEQWARISASIHIHKNVEELV